MQKKRQENWARRAYGIYTLQVPSGKAQLSLCPGVICYEVASTYGKLSFRLAKNLETTFSGSTDIFSYSFWQGKTSAVPLNWAYFVHIHSVQANNTNVRVYEAHRTTTDLHYFRMVQSQKVLSHLTSSEAKFSGNFEWTGRKRRKLADYFGKLLCIHLNNCDYHNQSPYYLPFQVDTHMNHTFSESWNNTKNANHL